MIICAAVKLSDNIIISLPRCFRHPDIYNTIYKTSLRSFCSESIDGFLDINGNFLNRKEAMEYAKSLELHFKLKLDYSERELLYSEDLW